MTTKPTVLFQQGPWRITEIEDPFADLSSLKGDCYDPRCNPDISPEQLALEEREFEKRVQDEGVYGYLLEKWNPEVDKGWQHVDSCFGFIGNYNSIENDHYIVNELINTALRGK